MLMTVYVSDKLASLSTSIHPYYNAKMMNIQVISQETLKPSNPTPDHLRYLQLSLFDQLNSPFFVPTIYFFNRPNNTETTSFLDNLKSSFLTTLSLYYPLAGRLHNDNFVVCNDEGVPYIQARLGSTRLSDIVQKAQVSDLDLLLPTFEQKGFPRLLLAIQVNIFSCGGIGIGVKSNHRLTDGYSLLMFINAWADLTNGKDHNLIPRPYFDIAKLFPPQHVHNPIDLLDDPNPQVIMVKPVAKWFMFRCEKLDILRSTLCTTNNMNSLPSLGSVLSAFIWSRIILSCKHNNNNNNNNNNNKPYEVFSTINIRPKVSSPAGTKSFYYGNMLVNAIAKPSCVLDDDDGALCVDFLNKVKVSVKNITNDSKLIDDIKEGKQDLRYVTDQFDRVKKGEIRAFGFSNLPSIPVLEPDFGWGNPVWAMPGTMIQDLVFISRAGPYSKDLIATINMNKEDMMKLEADQGFNAMVFKKASPLATCSKL